MRKIKSIIIGILLIVSILTIVNPVSAATITVNPGDSIQTAINGAAPGDTIVVYPGTYNETITINKLNLTLKSAGGRDVTKIVAPGTSTPVISIGDNLEVITVEGFTVVLSSTLYNPSGIIQSSFSTGSTTCYILYNRINVPYRLRNGIQVVGKNSKVIGNIVEGAPLTDDWAGSGITIISPKYGTGTTQNIVVKDNHILGGMDVGIGVIDQNIGYVPGEVFNTLIENNIIEKTVSRGIDIGGKVTNILIKNNIIRDNLDAGIRERHDYYFKLGTGNPTGTKVYYNQFCNNGIDIDIYEDPNDSYVIGDPKLDARGNTGCPTTLPMNKFLSILRNNRCKNHPDLEGCKVIATENYVRLDGNQFKLLIENKEDIYLIDVRTEQMYSDGHLSVAVNIPYSKLGDMISTIPKDRKVV